VQDLGTVLFLFFPVIGEFDRSPVGDVPIFSLAKDSVEHSRGTQQTDMSTMQRRQRPASNLPLPREKHSTCLAICRRLKQQILHFI
jgi:hypothetical protein